MVSRKGGIAKGGCGGLHLFKVSHRTPNFVSLVFSKLVREPEKKTEWREKTTGKLKMFDTYRHPNSISIHCIHRLMLSWTCPLPLDLLWYISG